MNGETIKIKKNKLIFFLKIAVIAILLYFGFRISLDFLESLPRVCLWHNLFGIEKCWGCGMTRALVSLLKADFKSAWFYNKSSFIIAPILFWLVCKNLVNYYQRSVACLHCMHCGNKNEVSDTFCVTCGKLLSKEEGIEQKETDKENSIVQKEDIVLKKEHNTNVRYAGFWLRFLAFVVDTIIVSLATTLWTYMTYGVTTYSNLEGVSMSMGAYLNIYVIPTLIVWLYEALFESSVKQATLGKQLLGLKVTDLEGRRISFARATGRHFAKIISAMILLIGYLMVAFTKKKQGLHDIMANCLVVKG